MSGVPSFTCIHRLDYVKEFPKATTEIAKWIEEGKMKSKFTVIKGLSKMVEGMNMLFSGGNTGKLFVTYFPFPLIFLTSDESRYTTDAS